MKKRLHSIVILFLCLLLLGVQLAIRARETAEPAFPQGYQYPVVPRNNHQATIAACEIPEEVLTAMTTPEVLESALNYPLNPDATLYSTPEQGFLATARRSNVYRELLGRPDLAEALLARYDATSPNGRGKIADFDADLTIRLLEIMLQQDVAQAQMSAAQKEAAAALAEEKYREKKLNPEYYGESPVSYYVRVPLDRARDRAMKRESGLPVRRGIVPHNA